ncbi:NXPE family member 3-like [Diadema antillarum]|uniref:NXPE family member 3-like n=1 Tax=Diadema antillarum TaxID=105358 RepID=UPI003A8C6863
MTTVKVRTNFVAPPIRKKLSFTSNKYSTVELVRNPGVFKVGDVIQIRINARSEQNLTKKYGGDYFRVKLYTAKSKSSTSFDVTNDLGNGTYVENVTLRWPGRMEIHVSMIHCAEAVRVLEKIRGPGQPARMVFTGRYMTTVDKKPVFEDRKCVPEVIADESACDFTDNRTGYPFFCQLPTNGALKCDDWTMWVTNGSSASFCLDMLTEEEKQYLSMHKVPIKGSPIVFNVNNNTNDWLGNMTKYQKSLPPCLPGQHLKNAIPSGFFFNDVWYSDQCEIQRPDKAEALACMRNRDIYIYGDSTVRQYYDFLASAYGPTLRGKRPRDKTETQAGPKVAADTTNNITVHYNFQGFPARPSSFLRRNSLDYIVNRLDSQEANDRTVVLICVGTHYTIYSLEMYLQRIKDIRAAVERLHARSPNTLVVLKSANTRNHKGLISILTNSEWYIKTIDLKMREVFSDYAKVAFIDAWDITVAQNFPHNVHPKAPVLKNLVNYFFSFMCPKDEPVSQH